MGSFSQLKILPTLQLFIRFFLHQFYPLCRQKMHQRMFIWILHDIFDENQVSVNYHISNSPSHSYFSFYSLYLFNCYGESVRRRSILKYYANEWKFHSWPCVSVFIAHEKRSWTKKKRRGRRQRQILHFSQDVQKTRKNS